MEKRTHKNLNSGNHSAWSDKDSLKGCLYKAIWQICIIASTNEWPLLFLGLGTTLLFSKNSNWPAIRRWWFDINNWLVATFMTLLYTMIRHNVEINSLVFFAKRTILVSLTALSLNYLLNYDSEAKLVANPRRSSRLKSKAIYIASQISICLLIIAPFIANQGVDSDIFDQLLGIQGASKATSLIFLMAASSMPLVMKANKNILAIYCLFTLTSTILFAGAQSRLTAGVMGTSMIYILGYIHKSKILNLIGRTCTKLWIAYYAFILPLCTIAAPIIHERTKWLAKILYTVTGSRYTLTWSANLWHENGLNFLNNNKASSVFSFLSKPYFDTDFTSLYGTASELWKHGADVYVPGGAHSIFISMLLKSKSITLISATPYIVIALFMVLLIVEYKNMINSEGIYRNTIMSLEVFIALMLSILTTESISLTLLMLTLSTYLLILTNNQKSKNIAKSNGLTLHAIHSSLKGKVLHWSSPTILIMPIIIYGSAYLLAKMNLFAYFFKS